MSEKGKYAYPFQVGSIKRSKKVLGVDAQLYLPTEKEEVNPLEIHSGFSRFVFTIVDKEAGATPTANIPASEIEYVKKKTEIAMQRMVDSSNVKESKDGSPLGTAYTQKLFDKNYKGKTPAEVLINNPEEADNLKKTRDWLQANVAKYPNNKAQIEAIDEALLLLSLGDLNATGVPAATKTVEIYKTDYKYMSKTNAKGYNRVYGISIVCDPTRDYPFIINIMNCYAPVESYSTGQKNIKMQSAEEMVKTSLPMTECEWYSLINRVATTLENFETMCFVGQWEEAKANSYHHD